MIKKTLIFFLYFSVICVNSQNVTVDSHSYTPQQLIEDILIDSLAIDEESITFTVLDPDELARMDEMLAKIKGLEISKVNTDYTVKLTSEEIERTKDLAHKTFK